MSLIRCCVDSFVNENASRNGQVRRRFAFERILLGNIGCVVSMSFTTTRFQSPLELPRWKEPLLRRFGVFVRPDGDLDPPVSFRSWEEVKETIEKWKEREPSVMVLTSLFQNLQALQKPPEELDLDSLLNLTQRLLCSIDSETLARIYYWICKTNIDRPDFLENLTEHILQKRDLSSFLSKHLALMIHGTGWLVRHWRKEQKQPFPEEFFPGMAPFVDQIAKELASPPKVLQLKEQDLANALYSFGLLRYGPNEVIYPLLTQIEKPEFLPRFLEQELSNMLLGMSSLSLAGHPAVTTLATEIVERERLRMYKEPELCSIFYSLACLRYNHPHILSILLLEAVRSGRMENYREHHLSNLVYAFDKLDVKDERVWRLLLKEITLPERLPKFEPAHLSNILYAVGRCEYRDEVAMRQILDEVCKGDRIEHYSTREFSLMLYGMGRTQTRHLPTLKAFSQELAKPGRLQVQGLHPKTLSGILLSFATLRHHDPELVERFISDVLSLRHLEEADPEVLCQYVFSFGKFKMPFCGSVRDVAMTLLESEDKLKTLTDRGLGMLIYGLGQMGSDVVPHMRSVLNLLSEGIGRVERFSIQDLAMLIYSFGQMRLEDYELMDRMLQAFTRPDRIFKATPRHLSNLMYGLGQLRYPIKDLPLEMLESELVRDIRVRSFSGQELANLILSIGLLNVDHRPGMQRVVEKLIQEAIRAERLAQFNELELNCFLTGLSHLHHRDPSVLVPLLEEMTQPARLERFKENEIASAMHVIAQLGVCPDEICEKLLLEARKPERLQRYDHTSIVMMVYALGRLQNQNYPEIVHAFAQKLLESSLVDRLGENHLSNFFYGVAHARYDSPEVLKHLFKEISRIHRLSKYNGAEILNIMKSVLALKDRNAVVDGLNHIARIFAIEMTTASRIPRYSPSQLTHVLFYLSAFRNKNVATVLPILEELGKPEKLHQLTSIDVSRAVFSVGPLAFLNQALHPRLALAVKPILKQAILGNGPEAMNCHSIAELMIGMSMLGLHDTYLLDNLSTEIIKPARLRSFRAWHLSRIFFAVGQLRYQNLELLRALAGELSRPDRAQRLDYRHWSNILSAVLMLKFKDEAFAKVIEKQIPSGEPSYEKLEQLSV